jgi:hypothetical protein
VIDETDLLEPGVAGRPSVSCTCRLLVRRTLVDEVGGWGECLTHGYTEQAFARKLFLASRILPIDGCWAWYRQHPGSSTGSAEGEHHARQARLAYLSWLGGYVRGKPPVPGSLRGVIRRERWRTRHPLGDYLLDRGTYLRRKFDRLAEGR